ncbi:arylsulfatase [Pullulanibacillus camelliae]|uniref:Arylsulfatase n=1 Tax=Pullulanibacillus camelliae TaxID=1707096 RepID=A0A8J2VLR3_9BACL|nr:sulfatase-like hydrolase/transferase [Pullulanibacillus camelliae]GGE27673.1 arylsulfatase [Pullulanibacillus camelliae]
MKKKPNMLLIVADQHRMDCLGAYGNQEIKTPHLDSLAKDGVVYENSFCVAPLCTPSRYSLMTGLYPHQHQGYTNHSTISEGTATFPRLLKEQGYRTEAIGKMHLTPTYLDIGFEHMQLAEQNGEGRFEDDYHRYLRAHDLVDKMDLIDQVDEYRYQASDSYWDSMGTLESNLPEQHHSTSWIGEKALSSISQWGAEEANFLMVSFIKPHHPFDPPEPWSTMYDPKKLTILPGWTEECLSRDLENDQGFFPHKKLTKDKLKKSMAYYYASISHIDFYVGKIMECLKTQGLYEDTLIIYTSDHGEYLGFHHLLLKNNYMYDPLVKVPLIIKRPKEKHKGTRTEHLVSNIDLAPTLLGFGGGAPDVFMAGSDLLSEHHRSFSERQFIFSEQGRGQQYMIRSRSHKLILDREESKCLFFDLEKDPLEFNNLYHDSNYQGLILQFKQALYTMILFDNAPPSHTNHQASVIRENNVPRSKKEKLEMANWVRAKMRSEQY